MFKLRKEQTVTGSPVRETLRLAKLSRELSQLNIYCMSGPSIFLSIYLSVYSVRQRHLVTSECTLKIEYSRYFLKLSLH